MKTKRRKPPLKTLWVLVDKRGAILEHGYLSGPYPSLYHNGGSKKTVPVFTFWGKKCDAEWQRREIKASMPKEVWDTWQFRVYGYVGGE